MTTKTYDPDQVDVLFGLVPLTGWADGSFITITYDEKTFTVKSGTDGQFTRSKRKGRIATVTAKLMQSSDSNAVLSAAHEADYQAPNGAGIVPLLVRDKGGTTLFACAEAWVTGLPDQDFDREAGSREWEICATNPTALVGGN